MRYRDVCGLVTGLVLVLLAVVLAPAYLNADDVNPVGKDGTEIRVNGAKEVRGRPQIRRPGSTRISEEARQALLKKRTERRWKHLDKNGDGILTRNEFGNRQKMFSAMDKDGNGEVSQAEHAESMKERVIDFRRGQRLPPIMRRLDTDRDLRLSKKEAPRLFERTPNPDTDSDGYISREELLQAFSGARRRERALPRRQLPQLPGTKGSTATPGGSQQGKVSKGSTEKK